jgi:ribosomal-protein-serine acetyltransferase
MDKQSLQLNVNEDIILRQVLISDAQAIFTAIDTGRDYLGKWLPFVEYTQTLADSEMFIHAVLKELDHIENYVFVILYKNNFAGLIGFKGTDSINKRTEIGYWLQEQFQKKGIITQSLIKLLEFAFEKMDMHRIQIRCGVGNIPSKNIPKRLNFTLEGIECDGELLSNGKYIDLEVYSKLRTDK